MTTEFDQDAVMQQVTAELQEKFPQANPAEVASIVREEVLSLAERPVHDYVAILSKRAARKRLKRS